MKNTWSFRRLSLSHFFSTFNHWPFPNVTGFHMTELVTSFLLESNTPDGIFFFLHFVHSRLQSTSLDRKSLSKNMARAIGGVANNVQSLSSERGYQRKICEFLRYWLIMILSCSSFTGAYILISKYKVGILLWFLTFYVTLVFSYFNFKKIGEDSDWNAYQIVLLSVSLAILN